MNTIKLIICGKSFSSEPMPLSEAIVLAEQLESIEPWPFDELGIFPIDEGEGNLCAALEQLITSYGVSGAKEAILTQLRANGYPRIAASVESAMKQ